MKDSTVQRFDLPVRFSVKYIREVLEDGTPLARALGSALPLERGSVWTYAPPDFDRTRLLGFSVGGVTSTDESDPILCSLVRRHLDRSPSCYALFEHSEASVTDPLMRRLDNWVAYNAGVYFLLASSYQDPVLIKEQIQNSRTYRMLGILLSTDILLPRYNKRDLSKDLSRVDLGFLISGVRMLIVGAYDCEGFIGWSR